MSTRNFVVTVKEFGDGQPWLLVELHEDIGLGDSLVSMKFPPGTEYEKAAEVARFINENVQEFGVSSA